MKRFEHQTVLAARVPFIYTEPQHIRARGQAQGRLLAPQVLNGQQQKVELRYWYRPLAPIVSAGVFLDPSEILGEVLEGDHIIHVLTRISCRQASTGKPRWKS